jgi:cyanophycinase
VKHLTRTFFFLALNLTFNLNLIAQGYICAVGGGSENYNSWSDAPYSWVVQKADSGKIIIIGVSSSTTWLPDYFMSLGADTAYNKTIGSIATADLQETFDELITAKAIFIRGGDQWNYIRYWKGTKTDSAINYIFQNGGVISGTSAGLAVLGDVDFSARFGTVYPDESLINPFNNYMQFEDNFLKLVPNVLFDSHFIERARHGRLVAMLYNRYFTTGENLIGIGIDDRTAFCISSDGIGEAMGSGAVTIFTIDDETELQPLNVDNYTIERMKCDQLTKGWKYDLNNRSISYIPPSAKEVDSLREWEYPITNFWLTGSDNISSHIQTNFADFIANVNPDNFVLITHPGYSTQLAPLISYLDQVEANYEIVYLNNTILNEPTISQIINEATNFVFAGDSLNVLSLLNDTSTVTGRSFRERTVIDEIPVFFFGKSGKIAGKYYTDNLYSDVYAGYRGKITSDPGLNLFGDFVFEPMLFDESNLYENRMSSALWGLMKNRKRFGVYLHGDALTTFNSSTKIVKGYGNLPPIYIDASQTSHVDSSTFIASGGVGPRQVVAMNNLRYNITTYDGYAYLIEEGKFDNETFSQTEQTSFISDFILYQNYPNPFNPYTTIRFVIPSVISTNRKDYKVELKVFDTLGKEVVTLVDEYRSAGIYEVIFNTQQTLNNKQLSSGVYFYRLLIENRAETKSMLLLK